MKERNKQRVVATAAAAPASPSEAPAPPPAPEAPTSRDMRMDDIMDSELTGDDEADALIVEMRSCETMEDVMDVVADEVTTMRGPEVAVALYRIAYLSKYASREDAAAVYASDAFKALQALVMRSKSSMSAKNISNCMWALAKTQQVTRTVVVTLCYAWNATHLRAASLLDNAQFLWAMGSLGFVPQMPGVDDDDFLVLLMDRVREQIAELSVADHDADRCVSMAIGGASKCRFMCKEHDGRRASLVSLRNVLERYLRSHLDTVGGRSIANMLRGLADLGHARPELWDATAAKLVAAPGLFNAQEMCMMISAYAKMCYHPGPAVALVAEQLVADGEETSATNATYMLMVLAKYGPAGPQGVVSALAGAVAAGAADLPLSTVSNAVWALAALKAGDLREVALLTEVFAAKLRALDTPAAELAPGLLRNMFHADIMLSHSGAGAGLPEAVRAVAARQWIMSTNQQNVKAPAHMRVGRALSALRVPHVVHQPTDDGLLQVHCAVQRSGGQRPLGIMLTGYSDYITGPGVGAKPVLSGVCLLETELLEAAGYHVVRVPSAGLMKMPNAQFVSYVAQLLGGCGVPVPKDAMELAIDDFSMAARERRAERSAGQARQQGALELRDAYAAAPDGPDTRALSARTRLRRSAAGGEDRWARGVRRGEPGGRSQARGAPAVAEVDVEAAWGASAGSAAPAGGVSPSVGSGSPSVGSGSYGDAQARGLGGYSEAAGSDGEEDIFGAGRGGIRRKRAPRKVLVQRDSAGGAEAGALPKGLRVVRREQ